MADGAPRRIRRSTDLLHRWRAGLFGLLAETPSRRRAGDAIRLFIAVVLLGLVVLDVRTDSAIDDSTLDLFDTVPDGLKWVVTAVRWLGSVGVVVAIVLLSVLTKRYRLARDAGLAALLAWCAALAVRASAEAGASALDAPGTSENFPVLELAAAVAVVATVAPYLARPARRTATALVTIAVVAAVPAGYGLPLDVLAAALVGWAIAAVVHLAFGSPVGMPTSGQVTRAAADLGIGLHHVQPLDVQEWGVARYEGSDDCGHVEIAVYGRDASSAQLLAKLWRFVFYRDAGQTVAITRALQVEHEAYLILSASRAGVVAPDLVVAGVGGDANDALLVTRSFEGPAFMELEPEKVTDDTLTSVWSTVTALGDADLAHGSLDGDANALMTTGLAVGPERAIKACVDAVGLDRLATALPQLQPAAATRSTRHALHDHKHLVDELRTQGAEAVGEDVPELAKIRRLFAVDAVLIIGTFVGVWALISELSGFNDILATIKGANWWWVAVAFVLSQITNIAQAIAVTGTVSIPGGMGVMEAGLIAGLTAAGIPDTEAAAAVLTSRMFTAYLPPTWGWFVMVWMRRHQYL